MRFVAVRTRCAALWIAPLGAFALIGCRDHERSTTEPSAAQDIRAAAPTAPAIPPPSGADDCNVSGLTEADRLRAMLVVQTTVLTWDPELTHGDFAVAVPSPQEVQRALDIIRCDQGPRAASRRSRVIAKLLGNDPKLERAAPYLQRLGFADAAAIAQLRGRVLERYPPAVLALYARDPSWLEYAALRYLTTTELPAGKVAAAHSWLRFGPAPAQAQTTASCWRPEEPSSYEYVDPYLLLAAHVSVDIDPQLVRAHVDPQNWDVCGRFWNPPDPSHPGGTLDGALFVQPEWIGTGTCTATQPFKPDPTPPTPGDVYTKHYLFEQFFLPGPASAGGSLDASFQNILGILALSTTRTLDNGTTSDAHSIYYWLGTCAVDEVEGAVGGQVFGAPVKTILDSGDIEVWTEGMRTHVSATKKVDFSSGTWTTQLNPALRELNEQLGELACCL